MKKYILIPELKIHNANALSNSLTIGVPAMTAWLGAVHALERRIRTYDSLNDVKFVKMGLSYLRSDLQVYRGYGDYVNSIVGTGNPVNEDGSRASFIEEPRIHLTVSLLIEAEGITGDIEDNLCSVIGKDLCKMKVAGGDILEFKDIQIMYCDESNSSTRKIMSRLMPGFVLVERTDLLIDEIDSGRDSLSRLLDYIAVHNTLSVTDEKREWVKTKELPGWLVPIAVGFRGISELGKVKNQRDITKPHRFAEPIVTLGEFKLPYRVTSIDEIMWHYEYESDGNFYLCVN